MGGHFAFPESSTNWQPCRNATKIHRSTAWMRSGSSTITPPPYRAIEYTFTIGAATYRSPEVFWAKSLKKVFPGLPARSVKKSVENVPQNPKKESILCLGSGCGTAGKRTGPKWSKMVQMTILVKRPCSEPDFSIRKTKMDQNGPFWSILVHLGPPTVLWPFLRCQNQCSGTLSRLRAGRSGKTFWRLFGNGLETQVLWLYHIAVGFPGMASYRTMPPFVPGPLSH